MKIVRLFLLLVPLMALSGCMTTVTSYDAEGKIIGKCEVSAPGIAISSWGDGRCIGYANGVEGVPPQVPPKIPDTASVNCRPGERFENGHCTTIIPGR